MLKKNNEKICSGIFFDIVQSFPNTYFQQFLRTAFKELENQTLKISSQFSE